MSQILVLVILSAGLFLVAFGSAVRADKHGQVAKQHNWPSDKIEHELKENAWEILCVISSAISVMLGVLALVFWIV